MKSPKILRDITEVKINHQNELVVMVKDGLGQRGAHKVLDMDQETIYNLIIDAYYLGKIDQSIEVRRALGL